MYRNVVNPWHQVVVHVTSLPYTTLDDFVYSCSVVGFRYDCIQNIPLLGSNKWIFFLFNNNINLGMFSFAIDCDKLATLLKKKFRFQKLANHYLFRYNFLLIFIYFWF